MNEVPLIHMDPRPIAAIWHAGEDAGGWTTSQSVAAQFRCDKIVAYGENGQMATVPFYAVYRGEEIIARVPAQMVEVHYKNAGAA